MSSQVLSMAMEADVKDHRKKLFLIVLADSIGSDGEGLVDPADLARRCSMHPEIVKEMFDWLERLDVLRWARETLGDSRFFRVNLQHEIWGRK